MYVSIRTIRIYTHDALHQPEEALFSSRVCLRAPYPFFTTPPYVNVVEPSSATFNHPDEFAAKKLLVWQRTTGQGTAIAVIVTRSLIRMIPTAMWTLSYKLSMAKGVSNFLSPLYSASWCCNTRSPPVTDPTLVGYPADGAFLCNCWCNTSPIDVLKLVTAHVLQGTDSLRQAHMACDFLSHWISPHSDNKMIDICSKSTSTSILLKQLYIAVGNANTMQNNANAVKWKWNKMPHASASIETSRCLQHQTYWYPLPVPGGVAPARFVFTTSNLTAYEDQCSSKLNESFEVIGLWHLTDVLLQMDTNSNVYKMGLLDTIGE